MPWNEFQYLYLITSDSNVYGFGIFFLSVCHLDNLESNKRIYMKLIGPTRGGSRAIKDSCDVTLVKRTAVFVNYFCICLDLLWPCPGLFTPPPPPPRPSLTMGWAPSALRQPVTPVHNASSISPLSMNVNPLTSLTLTTLKYFLNLKSL